MTHAVLKLYEKELGWGVVEAGSACRALTLAIFYGMAGVLPALAPRPPLWHFVSASLETLGTMVVSGSRGLDRLVR